MMNLTMNLDDAVWFDWETYRNFLSVVFENGRGEFREFVVFSGKKEKHDIDQSLGILRLLRRLRHGKRTLVGYNNRAFDDPLNHYILMQGMQFVNAKPADKCLVFNQLAQDLSANQHDYTGLSPLSRAVKYPKGGAMFNTIDLMMILTVNKNSPSLKSTMVHRKVLDIMDLPYPYDSRIKRNQIEPLMVYNRHDTHETRMLTYDIHREISTRYRAMERYGVDLLAASDSKIAKVVLADKIPDPEMGTGYDSIPLSECLPEQYIFKTAVLKALEDDLLYSYIGDTGRVVKQAGVKNPMFPRKKDQVYYTYGKRFELTKDFWIGFGVGGLHSEDKRYPGVWRSTDESTVEYADVTSYYPMIGRNNGIHPKQVPLSVWQGALAELIDDRIEAKGLARKLYGTLEGLEWESDANTLKIGINSGSFGFLKAKFNLYYDPKAFFKITFGGQIALLDLIEKLLLAGITVLSANTDGIICDVLKDQKEKYDLICQEWQDRTNFELEFDTFKEYGRRDVNNYYLITQDNEIKTKGIFDDKLTLDKRVFCKGFKMPIISLALQAYFLGGIKPEDYIPAHRDIFDFCDSQRLDARFKLTGVDMDAYKARDAVIKENKKKRAAIRRALKKDPDFEYEEVVDPDPIRGIEYQKTNRWLYTKDEGVQLVKVRVSNGKEIRIAVGSYATILNRTTKKKNKKLIKNIDFGFYIEKTYDIIDKMEGNVAPRIVKPKAHQLIGYQPTHCLSTDDEEESSLFQYDYLDDHEGKSQCDDLFSDPHLSQADKELIGFFHKTEKE